MRHFFQRCLRCRVSFISTGSSLEIVSRNSKNLGALTNTVVLVVALLCFDCRMRDLYLQRAQTDLQKTAFFCMKIFTRYRWRGISACPPYRRPRCPWSKPQHSRSAQVLHFKMNPEKEALKSVEEKELDGLKVENGALKASLEALEKRLTSSNSSADPHAEGAARMAVVEVGQTAWVLPWQGFDARGFRQSTSIALGCGGGPLRETGSNRAMGAFHFRSDIG